jgi:hypothetical protein
MTHQVPSRKPLEDDVLFKTLRDLHPSEAQLRDIAVVEKVTMERLKVTDKVTTKIVGGRREAKKNASGALRRR